MAGDIDLRIQAGACRLRIVPPDSDAWVIASYEDPRGNVEVTGQTEANRLTIHVGRSPADFFDFLDGTPELTLELGKARRFSLTIEAGASESKVDLGGLPISRLAMSHGAGSLHVTFSAPNPEETSELKLGVGAGRTEASSLGNAKFHNLIVDGGAAACVLDFGGAIPSNANARISTAMASVELRIPGAVAAEITSEYLLGQAGAEGPEVCALERFHRDATWTGTIEAGGMGPGSPPMDATGRARRRWIQGGLWVVGDYEQEQHLSDGTPVLNWQLHWVAGWDPKVREYRASIADNNGDIAIYRGWIDG